MKTSPIWQNKEFTIRLATKEDFENYYKNYNPLNAKTAELTGSKKEFSKEEISTFFESAIEDSDYYLFLILAPDGSIIGESVINEIDREVRSAHFRIAIYADSFKNQGIGSWAVETACSFTFETLQLHRLFLEVYSFNPVAQRVYQKVGFQKEGILRDSVLYQNGYADTIVMSLLEDEWHQHKTSCNPV